MGPCPRQRHRVVALTALTLAAFALRVYRLDATPLSWDEGWTIGLSALHWREIARITSLDVHPPLYYCLFGLWLSLGRGGLWLRFLSVIAGLLTVPLAYVTGRTWQGEPTGLLAALVVALSPFLIYYAQVARMFSLCATLSLLATYCLLKAVDTHRRALYVGFVLSAVGALYTFYYTACVVLATLVYALVIRPRRWKPLWLAALSMVALYAPWLVYTLPPMLARVSTRAAVSAAAEAGSPTATPVISLLRTLADGAFGLVFAYGAGWGAVYLVAVLAAVGLVLAWGKPQTLRGLLLPLLATSLTLLAVAIGSRAHMFAARYLIPASPFLALLIAWAVNGLWQRSRWAGLLALLLAGASMLPTLAGYVYDKPYEFSEAFDPGADHRFLQDKTRPDDVVFFNVLSLAGHYERLRTSVDPPWSYVLRWDPVIEPLEPALEGRVLPATRQHRRLWFALYKGAVAANLQLKEWLDLSLYPAFGQWREDTLYVQYLTATETMLQRQLGLVFGRHIRLRAAAFTPQAHADDRLCVRLTWSTDAALADNYKVFVHLYTLDGRLVTQHDSVPVNELRPTWSWRPGEEVIDNHGLWVPAGASGQLRLVAGLYDPESNSRLTLPDGTDHAEIAVLEVLPTAD